MLSMERFQDVLHQAECSTKSVKFTFNKEVAFDQVQKAWAWVNDADSNYIVLVTENTKCNIPDGDPNARQPWHITNAVFDGTKNEVVLSAQPKTWEDAFSSWHLRVSSKGILPHVPQSRHSLAKRIAYNHTVGLSLAGNLDSTPYPLIDEDDVQVSVACTSCYTTGSLDFNVDVDWELDSGLKGTVSMTPNDLGAYITAQLSIEAEVTAPVEKTLTLLTIAPGVWNIGGFVDIGPTFKVNLAAGIDAAQAKIDIASGMAMTIQNGAVAEVDFSDSSNNQFSGWTPQFTPIMPDNAFSEEISVTAFVGAQLRVEFDIEILGEGFTAGLALDAPKLDLTLTGLGQTGGNVCDVPDADFGISFDVGVGVELDGFAGFGAATDEPNKVPFASTTWDLWSTCIPVASGPPPSAPAAPTSSSASIPYVSSSAYASASSSGAPYPSSWASAVPQSSAYPVPSSSYIVPVASSSGIPYPSSWGSAVPSSSAYPVASSSYIVPVASSSGVSYSSSWQYPVSSPSVYPIASSSYIAPAASYSVVQYSSSLAVYASPSAIPYDSSSIIAYSSSSAIAAPSSSYIAPEAYPSQSSSAGVYISFSVAAYPSAYPSS